MSHRPITQKKVARLRKAVSRRQLPAFINLVHWLKFRKHAQTSGEAERLILAGKVRVGSNRIGIETIKVQDADGKIEDQDVVRALVSAKFGPEIVVLP